MSVRKPRLYGLYEKVSGDRPAWKRLYPELAYTKAVAVRVFQDALLAPALGAPVGVRELRPIARGYFGQRAN